MKILALMPAVVDISLVLPPEPSLSPSHFKICRQMNSLLILLIECTLIAIVLTECQIDPLRIKPTPLVTDRNLQIIHPNSIYHVANIALNDEILIGCPGNQLYHKGIALGKHIITATCLDNSTLNFEGQPLDFYSLKCADIPKNTVRYTHRSCAEGGEEIEIGYAITDDVFLRQIKICFDTINFTPIYSNFNLTNNIGYRDGRVPRTSFEEDGFYLTQTNLDKLYQRNTERRTINALLDLDLDSNAYINNGDMFINRGHLTAKGDFVYGFQQLATFHYVNSAPQWASFNGGNWNELEISLRDHASSTGDLEVYTGVYGTSSLRNNRTGTATELFLHTINGRNLIPVPQLFWKMILDKHNNKGVVILGVNNTYEVDVANDVICSDISDRITWFNGKLKRHKHDVQLGYIYACSVPEFRRIVQGSPALNVSDVLL